MVLELLKIVHIVQICVDLSTKSKSNKAVYLYPSERSYHVHLGKSICHIQIHIYDLYIYIYIYIYILHLSGKSNAF